MIVSYAVTQSCVSAFLRAMHFQRRFASCVSGCEILVTTDRPFDIHRSAFPNCKVTVQSCDRLWKSKHFCLAQARNHAMDYAQSTDADWLFMVDCDTVIVQKPTIWPTTGLGDFEVTMGQRGEEFRDTLRRSDSPQPTHLWMIAGREIIRSYRFDTGYVGYSSEDTAFSETLKEHGIVHSPSGAKAIHLWHKARDHRMAQFNQRRFTHRFG